MTNLAIIIFNIVAFLSVDLNKWYLIKLKEISYYLIQMILGIVAHLKKMSFFFFKKKIKSQKEEFIIKIKNI